MPSSGRVPQAARSAGGTWHGQEIQDVHSNDALRQAAKKGASEAALNALQTSLLEVTADGVHSSKADEWVFEAETQPLLPQAGCQDPFCTIEREIARNRTLLHFSEKR